MQYSLFPIKTLLLTTALATGALLAHPHAAYAVGDLATPSGETVVAGAATFDRPAAGRLNVTEATDRAVIDWDSFDIGRKARTEFIQPSAGSLVVNRVRDGRSDPAQILGTLTANGKVMILDRNGILIGKDAKIDAGSIVAAAGDIDVPQVMSGAPVVRISDMAPDATVENKGRINVADAGLAALVAPTAVNSGTITARFGKVGIGAGGKVAVDLYGDGLISVALDSKLSHALAENSGKISAEGGQVQMTARAASGILDSVVNNSGRADVSSVTVKGGKIILSGGTGVRNSGKLDAHSALDGGSIKLSGRDVSVSGTANAESTGGKGGRVDLVAENKADVSGLLKAAGKTEGGVVKAVAHDIAVTGTGRLNAEAAAGTGGHVELDARHDAAVDGQLKANGKLAGGVAQINAHDINLGASSEVLADGTAGHGGNIDLFAAHALNADGYVSATGLDDNLGGEVDAKGHDINVGGRIMAMGGAGFGGTVDLFATHNVSVSGEVNTKGALGGGKIKAQGHDIGVSGFLDAESVNAGYSGIIELFAAHDVDVSGKLKTSGQDGGGFVKMTGHDITVEKGAKVLAELRGTGRGGDILMLAWHDARIDGELSTSGLTGGGYTKVTGHDVVVGKTGAILSEAYGSGSGGLVFLRALHEASIEGKLKEAGVDAGGKAKITGHDVGISGLLDASSAAGTGGISQLIAAHDVSVSGAIDQTGATGQGKFKAIGHDIGVTGSVDVSATADGAGGRIDMFAAHDIDIGPGGVLKASGKNGGGVIKLTGTPGFAHDVTVENGAFLFADGTGTGTGDGGDISLEALHNAVVGGGLRASGVNGGEIDIKGANVRVGPSADMLARGSNTGGKMVLTAAQDAVLDGLAQLDGTFGGGSFKMTGRHVSVDSLVNANAAIAGKGGIVSLLGTLSNFFSGIITARGGAASGKGGKVVIAAPGTITGTVDVSAPNGAAGTFIH